MDKKIELADIESFLNLAKIDFLEITPDEKPDFSVLVDQNCIGIELTEFDPNNKHSQILRSVFNTYESIKSDLVIELRKITNEAITFNFSIHKPIIKRIKKNQKSDIINFLVSHLNFHEVKILLSKQIFHKEFKYKKSDNEFIESVRISKSPSNETIYTSINDFYWVGNIPESKIQEIIDKKEKLIDFNKNSENWLLIILPEKEYSDGAFIEETIKNNFFTRFNKIYIYTRLRKKIFELRINCK